MEPDHGESKKSRIAGKFGRSCLLRFLNEKEKKIVLSKFFIQKVFFNIECLVKEKQWEMFVKILQYIVIIHCLPAKHYCTVHIILPVSL